MNTYQGNEGTTLEVCARILSLTGGTATSSDVAVDVSTSSDQASATGILHTPCATCSYISHTLSSTTAISDYSPTLMPSTLTFPAGSVVNNETCFDIVLESDNLVEGSEFFFIDMVAVTSLVTVDDNFDQANILILDLTRKLSERCYSGDF